LKGFTARAVTDVVSALSACADKMPDVLLLDVVMPKLSGWEVARLIRDLAGSRQPKIIVMTGHADDRFQELSRELKVSVVLVKPVPVEKLVEVLGSFVE
jgi:CheY-like chemotaxis protein